ncbi:RNA polymerase II transcription elongation factor SpEAF [Exophiala xenobiotica]|nr:RNA polymerase II transcription elongation factor SpEAF [Exophiala xenobiotica]
MVNYRRCLLSRKRKLSELFSIAAYPLHPDDPTYNQKLQAFHDANDLESGRLFDEATLPPRTHIVLRSRQPKASLPLQSSVSTSENLSQPTSLSKNDVASQPKDSSRAQSSGQPPLREEVNENGFNDEQQVVDNAFDGPSRSDQPSVQERAQDSSRSQESKAHVLPKYSRSPIRLVPPDEDAGSIDHGTGGAETTEEAPVADSGALSLPTPGQRRSPSPPTLAPVPSVAEPQSSPASTNGPESANTPVPTAASPGTSPGLDLQPASTDLEQQQKDSSHGQAESERSPPAVGGRVEEQPSKPEDQTGDVEMSGTENVPSEGNISKKPSVRIDTQTEVESYFKPRLSSGIVESPAQMTTAGTPKRGLPVTPSTQEPPKRATRISSGVLQKKSVSEILGETPKATTPQGESPQSMTQRDSCSVSTPDGRAGERRDKERSRLSTVVFAKPQKPLTDEGSLAMERVDDRQMHKTNNGERDYLYTLFENKAHSMSRQTSMTYLIQNAHKALSTKDHLIEYELSAECRILKRLYQLQEKQRWALRQYKRADEAPRPTSHWDFMLDHMKWMRTDFREERKWKLAAARGLAESCAEWVTSSPAERCRLQVKVRPPKLLPKPNESQDVNMEDAAEPSVSAQPTPELMPSNDDDYMSDDIADPREIQMTIAPAALFSLGASDFNFAVDHTPALDKLLNELPLYEPSAVEPDLSKSTLAERLDAKWKTDIVPVSRWTTEKLPVKEYKPPVKRSRYEYELELSPKKKSAPLPPEATNVALFMPENKHIRDRIHPGHSFRPPSEHPMPTQAFFETRSSSQWTHAEDDELRKLVKDYSYNWSLISSCLTPRSSYTSGADRRTPWECFERWIGLEGLPADMSKTAYFKTYSGRIEAAGRHVAAQIEEAQRRAGANVQIPARKRTTQPVRVERKRTQRHLAMLDAMRKLAKKRETALQKQQHQADLAAMRKVNDANVPKPSYKTPAEFSQLKQEREAKLAERQEIYRQQLIAHQRATAQQQRGQNPQSNNMPNGMPPGAPGMRGPTSAGGLPAMPNGNLQVPNGHPRHPAMMAMQANMQLPPGMVGPKGLTPQMQAQMQAQMASRGAATSPQQMRMLQEASRVQQEQLMRQAQQAQNGVHSSPNNPHAALAAGKGINNAAYMAAMGSANGVGSPGHMTSASPRPTTATSGQALSSGHIPVLTQIANKIREHHPNLTEEEVNRLASQQITQYQQQATAAAAGQTQKRQQPHNQAALNAAIGAVNAGNHASNQAAAAAAAAQFGHQGMMTNEQIQQYNQRMRMQQAQQHAVRGMQGQMQPGVMGAMANGMNNSPVMTMARPVSQHANQGQMSRSATPRDQRSGSQSNINVNVNVNGTGSGPQSSPRPAPAQQMQI